MNTLDSGKIGNLYSNHAQYCIVCDQKLTAYNYIHWKLHRRCACDTIQCENPRENGNRFCNMYPNCHKRIGITIENQPHNKKTEQEYRCKFVCM